jgi:hypothetical protein
MLLRNGFVTAASLAMVIEDDAYATDCLGMAERIRAIHGGPDEPDNQPTVDAAARRRNQHRDRAPRRASAGCAGRAHSRVVAFGVTLSHLCRG